MRSAPGPWRAATAALPRAGRSMSRETNRSDLTWRGTTGRAPAARPFLKRRYARGEGKAHGQRAQRARLILLAVAVGAGLLAILGRCAHLQVIRSSELLDLARAQQERTITLDPLRGPILDRNGKELAVSLDVDSVFAVPA